MTFVIISGGIDLSVGSALALTGVVMARLVAGGWNVPAAISAGLFCGLAIGAANGFGVVRMRIPPFIVTLGGLSIARGLAFVAAGGRTIPVAPATLRVWGESRLAGVPVPTIIAVLLVIISHVVLTRTVFGRHLMALGRNERATQFAGVNTDRVKWSAYVISGLAVCLGALISVGRLGSADPIRGEGYELDAIAAVIIGGTSLAGGRGSVLGTLLGALFIAVLRNGLNLQDVTAAWQQVIIGAVIVGAVFLDRLKDRKVQSE
jgi:ribose transport system permease protein